MLAIRLRRAGSKRDPHYRVVVTDSRASRDGRFVEILGHYHPRRQPTELVLDLEKVDGWIERGAQMSHTVRNLVKEARRGGFPDAEVAAAAEAEAEPEQSAEAEAEAKAEAAAESRAGAEAEESEAGDGDDEDAEERSESE